MPTVVQLPETTSRPARADRHRASAVVAGGGGGAAGGGGGGGGGGRGGGRRALGHGVGTHPDPHRRLPERAASGGDGAGGVVGPAGRLGGAEGEKVWFRPPYGEWSDQVAALLDAEPALATHAGPVLWNIG